MTAGSSRRTDEGARPATSEPYGGPASRAQITLDVEREQAAALVADLERELHAVGESTAAGPDDEHDAEGATVGYERARVSSLLDAARRRLGSLDEAVARVSGGQYGRCGRCGAAIGAERLAALPATTRCIACAAPTRPALAQPPAQARTPTP